RRLENHHFGLVGNDADQRLDCKSMRHQHERARPRSEEHTSELQSRFDLVCRLLLEKKKTDHYTHQPALQDEQHEEHADLTYRPHGDIEHWANPHFDVHPAVGHRHPHHLAHDHYQPS